MSSSQSTGSTPAYTLCKEIGLDTETIQRRIEHMDLTIGDKPILRLLEQKVFTPYAKRILDGFYAYLLQQGEMRHFIKSAEQLTRLKQTQAEYLLKFGVNYDTQEYFEYRLRIGIAHARIELPVHLYLSAYSKMQGLLQDALFSSTLSEHPEMLAKCFNVVAKIILLDISLALDAYNHITTTSLNRSVHELKHAKDILTNQLMHDSLTGVLSRAYILDALQKKLAATKRNPNLSFSLAMIDIDFFKHINDKYGHLVGDVVLQQFCTTIQSTIRQQDYFGRYGGEEFLLLINDSNPSKTLKLVERIRKLIDTHIFTVNEQKIHFTISIGIAHATDNDDRDGLIERADTALYKAKSSGRNQTCREEY